MRWRGLISYIHLWYHRPIDNDHLPHQGLTGRKVLFACIVNTSSGENCKTPSQCYEMETHLMFWNFTVAFPIFIIAILYRIACCVGPCHLSGPVVSKSKSHYSHRSLGKLFEASGARSVHVHSGHCERCIPNLSSQKENHQHQFRGLDIVSNRNTGIFHI